MKHRNRILLIVALLMPLVSIGTGALIVGDLLTASRELQLQDALEQAKDSARQSATLAAAGDESEHTLQESQKQLQLLGRQKRAVRLQISTVLHSLGSARNRQDQAVMDKELALRSYGRQQDDFSSFVRYAHLRHDSVTSGPTVGGWIMRRLMGDSLGDSVDADLRDAALSRAREQILERLLIAQESDAQSREQLHAAAGELGDQLSDLQDQHATLRKQYNQVLRTIDLAERTIRASEEQLAEIKRDTDQVQADILSMQSELDRIDGRLRAKAERELVQKGLMQDSPDRFKQKTFTGKGAFIWPVAGPVTAGFHDPGYFQFFGMQHEAIDIAVPFATPVASASDGIVFIVRLGGMKGYTYVMIGHRGGYATVYGHLSEVSVHAGDTVSAGQIIGLSGGAPGTEGAGKMTTGAHLHFEVILRGEHVDPKTVLP